MQYISLKDSSLTYFIAKGEVSELSGSSRFNVFDNEIVSRPKPNKNKIENTTATCDYLHSILSDNMSEMLFVRLLVVYTSLWQQCKKEKFTSERKLDRLELLEGEIMRANKCGYDFMVKYKIVGENIAQSNSRYQTEKRKKKTDRVINRSKVKSKMYALFNLKNSRKFMAFYSVSFPVGTSDNQAFECWNAMLTACRKRFNLTNYVWVTERQKNGTLHYHMLTNNWLPVLLVNKIMAKIIDNKVNQGLMSWGSAGWYNKEWSDNGVKRTKRVYSNPCMSNYNGVDVDSIFNSKRHKKTGKNMNPTEVREWVSKYVTKYVTKNTEKFTHLCWHCSRSVSMLFTSTILFLNEKRYITDCLPFGYLIGSEMTDELSKYYMRFKSEFNDTWAFLFKPPQSLYEKIKLYNDMISIEYEPQRIFKLNNITN
jgi:hypothetical protein